jgi:hypothetical protein
VLSTQEDVNSTEFVKCWPMFMNFFTNYKTNSLAFNLQRKYTYWATAAGRRNLVLTFADRGVSHGQRDGTSTVVTLGVLYRSHYFFIQVEPHFSSRGWVDPVPNPLLSRKSGRTGNQTRDLWVCSQELWSLAHRRGRWNYFTEKILCNIRKWIDATEFWRRYVTEFMGFWTLPVVWNSKY